MPRSPLHSAWLGGAARLRPGGVTAGAVGGVGGGQVTRLKVLASWTAEPGNRQFPRDRAVEKTGWVGPWEGPGTGSGT